LANVAVGDVEQQLLGPVDDLLGILGGVEGERGNLGGGLDHLAQGGVAVKHLDVPAPTDEGQRVVAKAEQERTPADSVEIALGAQLVGQADGVDGEVLVEHLAHCHKDDAVRRVEEIIRRKADQALLERLGADHHGREDRGLRLEVLGHVAPLLHRHLRRVDPVVVSHRMPFVDCVASILPSCRRSRIGGTKGVGILQNRSISYGFSESF